MHDTEYGLHKQWPSDNIDPKQKGRDWTLNCLYAILGEYMGGEGALDPKRVSEIADNRKYFEGSQDVASEFTKTAKDADSGAKVSYIDIDYQPIGVMRRFTKIVLGYFHERKHNWVANATDPLSMQEKHTDIYLKKTLRQPEIQSMWEQQGVDLSELYFIPTSKEEEEIYRRVGQKNAFEIVLERLLKYVYAETKYDLLIKPDVGIDFICANVAALWTRFDENGKIVKESILPEELILSDSRWRDFSDSRYRGRTQRMTIQEAKSLDVDGLIKEEDWLEIAKKYSGQFGNQSEIRQTSDGTYLSGADTYVYDRWRINVWYCEWESIDVKIREKKKLAKGDDNYSYRDRPFDHKFPKSPDSKKKRKKISCRTTYYAYWIPNTNYLLQYGPRTNILRDKNNKKEPIKQISVVRASSSGLRASKTLVECMQPIEKLIQASWQRLQDALAKARPKGHYINVKAVMNAINNGVEAKSPQELLDAFEMTGDLYGSNTDEWDGNQGHPVIPLDGGIGTAGVEYVNIIKFCDEMLSAVTGVNPIVSGRAAPSSKLNGVAEMEFQAAERSLLDLFAAYELLLQMDSEVTSKLISQLFRDKDKYKGDAYRHALSSVSEEILKAADGLHHRDLAIVLENRTSSEDIKELRIALQEAKNIRSSTGKGGITEAIYLNLLEDYKDNPKWARARLGFEIERQRKKDMEEDMARQEMNQKVQMASNQQTHQNKMAEMEAEVQGKVMLEGERRKTLKLQIQLQNQGKLALSEKDFREELELQKQDKLYGSGG